MQCDYEKEMLRKRFDVAEINKLMQKIEMTKATVGMLKNSCGDLHGDAAKDATKEMIKEWEEKLSDYQSAFDDLCIVLEANLKKVTEVQGNMTIQGFFPIIQKALRENPNTRDVEISLVNVFSSDPSDEDEQAFEVDDEKTANESIEIARETGSSFYAPSYKIDLGNGSLPIHIVSVEGGFSLEQVREIAQEVITEKNLPDDVDEILPSILCDTEQLVSTASFIVQLTNESVQTTMDPFFDADQNNVKLHAVREVLLKTIFDLVKRDVLRKNTIIRNGIRKTRTQGTISQTKQKDFVDTLNVSFKKDYNTWPTGSTGNLNSEFVSRNIDLLE